MADAAAKTANKTYRKSLAIFIPMNDSTRSPKDQLRFLLKDKYGLTETQIQEIIHARDESLITEELKSDIELLNSGYPVDYIIGHTDFLNLKINLDHKPLIPRPETEYWTEKIINSLNKESRLKILDVFCGSGCIGLTLLKNLPNSNCTFSDKNPNYLLQTKQNADINSIDQSRLQLIESDVLTNIHEKFDLIVANPPYVSKHIPLEKSIGHEPKEAIFARKNGVALIDRFLQTALENLSSEGRIFMEFGETQKDEIESLLKNHKYNHWNFHKDQFGKWRWVELY